MSKPSLTNLCLVGVVIILLAACQQAAPPFECTDTIGCITIAPGEPIKLGVLQDLSGGAASIGLEQSNTIELAIARRGNQLLGHPITLLIEDSQCSPEGGKVATQIVVADPQVVSLLGTTCSGSAVTASKVMSEAGLVMVSGANSAPSLTQTGGEKGADWQAGYFRTRPQDAGQGQTAATFAFEELGITRVSTINDGDAYTKGLTDTFEQTFTGLGGEIVLDAVVNKGDTDMKPVLTAVAASGAELVFFPVFQAEGVHIVQQAKEVTGLEDIILMGAGALAISAFIEAVNADGEGMYFVSSTVLESAAADELISEYMSRYGQPPSTTAYATVYDAVNLTLDAIEAVALLDEDGTLHIGRQALRDALYATSSFEGITGTLACDEFGDCNSATFNIVRLDDPAKGFEGLHSNAVYTYTPHE